MKQSESADPDQSVTRKAEPSAKEKDQRSPCCLDCGHSLKEADYGAAVCPYCGVT